MPRPQRRLEKKFIIVDADRIIKHPGEKDKFIDLLNYCKLQNKKQTVPHFLIVDNPDFEYAACLHVDEYKGQDVKRFITAQLGFRSVEQFKCKEDIYDFLNSNGRSYQKMVNKIKNKPKLLRNEYSLRKKSFDIIIKDTILNWDMFSNKGSNLEEFFDVIDW